MAFDEQTANDISSGVAVLDSRKTQLARQIGQLQEQRANHPGDPVLAAEWQAKQEQLLALARQKEQLAAVTPATQKAVSFRETPLASQGPVSPSPARTAAVGGIIGLILAAALTWWLEGRASRLGPAPPGAPGGALNWVPQWSRRSRIC
jgi:uncharacterized protein involved in exopolysaccharide biosynthesis